MSGESNRDSDYTPHARYPTYALATGCAFVLVIILLPLAGIAYALYHYLTWVGAGQRSVTVAFVGGLLVKTFVIPAIVGAAKSKAFKVFKDWLRGGKPKSA